MWVNAKFQMALGVLAGLAMLAGCFGALYWLLAPERFPVSRVEIRGELMHTTRAGIEGALPRVGSNFFAADLAEVRVAVERLPWVRRVAGAAVVALGIAGLVRVPAVAELAAFGWRCITESLITSTMC